MERRNFGPWSHDGGFALLLCVLLFTLPFVIPFAKFKGWLP